MKTFAAKEKRSAPATCKSHSYVHHPMGPVQQSQQTVMRKILRPDSVQTKPNIDKYEQEADRVADQVMITSDLTFQRQSVNKEEEERAQAKGDGAPSPAPPSIESGIKSIQGGGQPLSESARNFFEPRFGVDFSKVCIRSDSNSAQMNETLRAKAFTHGPNIYFNAGMYDANSNNGKRLIAHELTHAVQQRASSRSPMVQKAGLDAVPKTSLKSMDIDTSKIGSLYDKLSVIFDPKKSKLQMFVGSPTVMKRVLANNITFVKIPKKLEFGFRNIASFLVGGGAKATLMGQQTSGKAPDSGETKSLLLKFSQYPKLKKLWRRRDKSALSEVRSDRAYRFTTYGSGATQKIMIEGLGKAKVETTKQLSSGKRMARRYSLKFIGKVNATRDRNVASAPREVIKNWTRGEKTRVTTALGILSAKIMETLAGLKMHRVDKPQSEHLGRGGKRTVQADYVSAKHILTVYDDAFKKNLNVFGEGAGKFTSALQQTVIHELGHAIDDTPFRVASAKSENLRLESNRRSGQGVAAVNDYYNTTYNAARKATRNAKYAAYLKVLKLYNGNLSSTSPELAKLGKILGKGKSGTQKIIASLNLSKPLEKKEFEARITKLVKLRTFSASKIRAIVSALKSVLHKHKVEIETLAFHGLLEKWYQSGGKKPSIPASAAKRPAKKNRAKVEKYRDSLKASAAWKKAREKVRSGSGYHEELKGIGNKAKWTRNKTEILKPGVSNAFRNAAKKDFPSKTINRITDYADASWAEMYAESHALYFTDLARFKLLRPNLYKYFAKKYKRP